MPFLQGFVSWCAEHGGDPGLAMGSCVRNRGIKNTGQKQNFKPVVSSVFVNQMGFSFQPRHLWVHSNPFGSKQQELKEWTSGKSLGEGISWDNPQGKGHKCRVLMEEHSYFVVRPRYFVNVCLYVVAWGYFRRAKSKLWSGESFRYSKNVPGYHSWCWDLLFTWSFSWHSHGKIEVSITNVFEVCL